ncbi:Putative sepiapterin reductase [Elusimicrobium minutum Pei191]|uniref:Putative sepiapterin reductase n=1 Tax=Elusimicrobium minutum (strain Pei191) TaxID=445932 RepID=B2KED2_ELUMP|nr:nitroreductase family protein [Elusimicrobium minutum]ACC98878.1 Putative sepiapterin reductase [Elusimicrobium minutum Pei191]
METSKAIFGRRSIRKYIADIPVDENQIKILLAAAMAAPTARNAQEWEFLVVRERETLQKIVETHPYASMLKEAPCAIIVCANLKKELIPGYWIGDCGAATQNILLAATNLGLGTVWLGVQAVKERVDAVRKIFNLPEHIMPFSIVAVGTPAEEKDPQDRYDEAKVHYGKW